MFIPNLWYFRLYSINSSYNARIFPPYATLCVTTRAIWAYTCTFRHYARLLILCFRFHISLVFLTSTRLRFTLLPLLYSKCLEKTTGNLSTLVSLTMILTIQNRIAIPSTPGESWFSVFLRFYLCYSRFYITPSTATGALALYIGCRCCQSLYEVMVR